MAKDKAKSRATYYRQITGISLNSGVGFGRVVLHHPYEYHSLTYKRNSDDSIVKDELDQLNKALSRLVEEIKEMISHHNDSNSHPSESKDNSSQEILDIYLMMAKDPGWRRQLFEKIEMRLTAVEAVDLTLKSIKNSLSSKETQSPWKMKVNDFEDLASRLKRHLEYGIGLKHGEDNDLPLIVIADRIGPAELLDYNRQRLAGLILVEHSHTAHVAIVARSLGIPVVGVSKEVISEIRSEDPILVDGNEGCVYLHPDLEFIYRFNNRAALTDISQREPTLHELATLPSQTLDGYSISLFLNAGLVEDVDFIEAAGAQGIGLFRTEIPFMLQSKLPTVVEQIFLYKEILKRAGDHPVVFRTLDVSGDKVLPYLEQLRSENAIRHTRAARVFFDRPILLRYQLRAMIRACEGKELTIMLPKVAEADEIKIAREVLEAEVDLERKKGNLIPSKIQLGAMIEVPMLIRQIPQLASLVDFFSVGSNDLFQFFYAIERERSIHLNRYDVLSSSFLSLLQLIQLKSKISNIPLSICGEMAGRPLEALALIGIGYHSLSMSASAVPQIKKMIRSLRLQDIRDFMIQNCEAGQGNLRPKLQEFVRDYNIEIE